MGFIYCATNKKSGKCYVGKSIESLAGVQRRHRCFAKKGADFIFSRAIRKYTFDAFEWTILRDDLEESELNIYEKMFIRKLKTRSPDGYNMTGGGDGMTNATPEVRERCGRRLRGKKYEEVYGEEKAAKIRGIQQAYRHTPEAKNKIGAASKKRGRSKKNKEAFIHNRPHTPEARKRISEANRGQIRGPHTEETKRKISIAHKGRIISPETREKIRQTLLIWNAARKKNTK